MAITLRKKNLEQKTAKTIPAEPSQGAGAPPQPAGLTPFSVEEKSPSYIAYGILGILAVLLFAGLVLIQWIEWSEYNRPGVFPALTSRPVPEGGDAAEEAPPAAPEEPVSDTVESAPVEETVDTPAEDTPADDSAFPE